MKKLQTKTENKLQECVKDWINEKTADYDCENKVESVLEDLFRDGCQSGYVSELIYYSDTVEFYDKYESEIWDLLDEQAKEQGQSILEFIAALNGSKEVGSNEQFKNLLAWFCFEESARKLANSAGLEI